MNENSNSSSFRIEHDLIGDAEIPKDAYYGIQTHRAMNNFDVTGMCPCQESSSYTELL